MNGDNEKLISRKDLASSDNSSEQSGSESDLDQEFRQILSKKLGPFIIPDGNGDVAFIARAKEGSESEEKLEFRLFSGPTESTLKIRVKSPDLSNEPPGFVVAQRPNSYYFKELASPQEQSNFDSIALSGEQVLSLSKVSWPGCSLPWRVQVVDKKRGDKVVNETIFGHGAKMTTPEDRSRRAKPGKKTRVAKRKKTAAVEKQKAKLAEKEAALREKKTKKNRLQKLKRREKKRNEKLAAGDEADVVEPTPT